MNVIERFIIIGDSLSDKGTMARSVLGAFSGLKGTSPKGRFTNGYVWDDFFCERVYREATAQGAEAKSEENPAKRPLFILNNDEVVATKTSPVYVRTYCEGGMTAHDYSDRLTGNIMLDATAEVLATLNSMREKVLIDDRFIGADAEHKKSTLVIEWSGANDLITVNTHPTLDAAELAVNARILNLEKMIERGYQHFILFNLPDLSLTPRFQKPNAPKEQAQQSVRYFNSRLQEKVDELMLNVPHCQITVFDANQLFTEAYMNPAKFGLDEAKKHQPFLESEAFKDHDETTTAEGFMFWDEVHPTEALHHQLASYLYPIFTTHYQFQLPKESLLQQFQEAYGMKWQSDQEKWSGRLHRSNIDYMHADLQTIIRHGLFEKGYRTRGIIQQLGWVDQGKQCSTKNSLILETVTMVSPTNPVIKARAGTYAGAEKVQDNAPVALSSVELNTEEPAIVPGAGDPQEIEMTATTYRF